MRAHISLILILIVMSACSDGPDPQITPSVPEQVIISGAGDLGIFDPSVAKDPGTGRVWMSYSSVKTSVYYPASTYWAVSIRLAVSDDNGASWQDTGVVAASNETLVGPMPASHPANQPSGEIPADSPGIWQSETSSLVYDASAPASERWKLIWFQYLNANLVSYFADYSWIAMKMAATPEGLLTATAVKLFAGAGLQADNTNSATPVFAPIAGAPRIQLNTDLSQSSGNATLSNLDLCIFAEPGLHATSSAIHLAIYCANAATNPITEYIEYFRCASPCTMTLASSWEYLGRLLTPADASAATGNHHFQAPSLVERNAKTYLMVTPVDTTSDERYNGCRVYEFTDVNSRLLLRDNGLLVERKRIDGESGTHNGACAATGDLEGGILLSQFKATSTPDTFKIFQSKVSVP